MAGNSNATMTTYPFTTDLSRFGIDAKPTKVAPLNKFYLDGVLICTRLSREEYIECQKELEEYLKNPPGVNWDPAYLKQQNDLDCIEYFSRIQEIRPEMADYVLVDPMDVSTILIGGFWLHFNFKAKHKDAADDSSAAIYFVELDVTNKEVTCLEKLDIDLSADTSAYQRCAFCYVDPSQGRYASSTGGHVYHPLDAYRYFK